MTKLRSNFGFVFFKKQIINDKTITAIVFAAAP